jgi:hypothetical protein
MKVLNINQCGDNIARVFSIFFCLADNIFCRTVGPATAICHRTYQEFYRTGPTEFRGDCHVVRYRIYIQLCSDAGYRGSSSDAQSVQNLQSIIGYNRLIIHDVNGLISDRFTPKLSFTLYFTCLQ